MRAPGVGSLSECRSMSEKRRVLGVIVSEIVLGFLLTAIAIQMVVIGLRSLGILANQVLFLGKASSSLIPISMNAACQ
jgi:hypothetical protein